MKHILFFVFAGLLISACANQNSSSPSGSSGGTVQGSSAADLQGTWKLSCNPGQPVPAGPATILFGLDFTYIFSGSNFSEANETFGGTNNTTGTNQVDCATPQSRTDMSGTFIVGGAAPTTTASVSATEIDFTYTSMTRTYLTAAAVSSANTHADCGLTGWVINAPRDIMNTSCSQFKTPPAVLYSIYDIVSTGLTLGVPTAALSGSTPATRPTNLGLLLSKQ